MDAIQKRLAAGEEFAALSVQFDEGFAKRQNGFGTGEKRSSSDNKQEDWVQPLDIEPTVWSLKPGQVSPVVQTPTGYHLVKVVEPRVHGHAAVRREAPGRDPRKIGRRALRR